MDATEGEAGGQASLISWLSYPLDVSKGCEALCPEEVDDYGFL